jgi:hypothetical protein
MISIAAVSQPLLHGAQAHGDWGIKPEVMASFTTKGSPRGASSDALPHNHSRWCVQPCLRSSRGTVGRREVIGCEGKHKPLV